MKSLVILNTCSLQRSAIFLFFVFALSSCNLEKDAPDNNIPARAKDFVYQKYPAASISEMQVLEAGKVYQIGFLFDGKKHQAIVSNSRILNTTRKMADQIPAELLANLDTLAIRGGQLSNPRIVESDYADRLISEQIFDYELNGKIYILIFNESGITLRPYQLTFYQTKSMEDLPEKIQEFINVRHRTNPDFVNSLSNLNEQSKQYIINNKELTFFDCKVDVRVGGTKNYWVTVNFMGMTYLTMQFGDNGDVISVPQFNRIRQFNQNFDKNTWAPNLTISEINYFRDLFAGQSQLFGFNLDSQQNFKSSFRCEYENIKSYQFVLYNYKGEYWSLQYNEQKDLVNYYYSSKM